MPTLTIARRLWLPVLTLALVSTIVSAFSIVRTRQLDAAASEQEERQQDKLEHALRWAGASETNLLRAATVLRTTDASLEALLKPQMEATSARISKLQKELEALSTDPDEKAALDKVAAARAVYLRERGEAQQLKAAGNQDGAIDALDKKVMPAIAAYQAAQQDFVKLQDDRTVARRAATSAERLNAAWVAAATIAGLVALLALATGLMVRSVRRPLHRLVALADRVGGGDLTAEIHTYRGDEIGDLERALGRMVESLRRLVGEVRSTAGSISSASTEIADGSRNLSERTEEAASSLQETASAMEQLTATVQNSAQAATQANQLASSASSVAQRGGEVVGEVVSTMDEINASSKKIADIISVIDGIAFQTNILALNAAVEAARAGEQGRGFAVVAGEVRTLAQRSAQAAKEIKALIGSSVDKVDTGAQLVRRAGGTMGEIVASVQRVTDIIGEITTASGEQSGGIGQVNTAVAQLDQMTQQNAALVEQSAAAAESLKQQAERLNGLVAGFRVQAADRAAPQPVAAPAAPLRPTPATRPAAPIAQARKTPAPAPVAREAEESWETF